MATPAKPELKIIQGATPRKPLGRLVPDKTTPIEPAGCCKTYDAERFDNQLPTEYRS